MTHNRLIPANTHNQILAVLYSLNGGINLFLITIALIILGLTEEDPLLHLRPQKFLVLILLLAVLFFAALYLLTGLGLWKKKRWARTSALVLGVIFVWYPVCLVLGLYAWLFLRSGDGRKLYLDS